jgi:hypothetical protein
MIGWVKLIYRVVPRRGYELLLHTLNCPQVQQIRILHAPENLNKKRRVSRCESRSRRSRVQILSPRQRVFVKSQIRENNLCLQVSPSENIHPRFVLREETNWDRAACQRAGKVFETFDHSLSGVGMPTQSKSRGKGCAKTFAKRGVVSFHPPIKTPGHTDDEARPC